MEKYTLYVIHCMSENFEYWPHTADIIVHAWGDDMRAAFVNGAIGMFAYMTDLSKVDEIDHKLVSGEFEDGATDEGKLFTFLDELLFFFSTEDYFICKRIEFRQLDSDGFQVVVYGEPMSLRKHTQGTEIKAITYHGMTVNHTDRVDVSFLLDI